MSIFLDISEFSYILRIMKNEMKHYTAVDKFIKRNQRLADTDNYPNMTSLYEALSYDDFDVMFGVDSTAFDFFAKERKSAYNIMKSNKVHILYECPCSNPKKQRHHYNYSRPTEVLLLCPSCHRKEHSRLKAGKTADNSLANHNELSGDDLMVREEVVQDNDASYGESAPCAGDNPQTVSLTAV